RTDVQQKTGRERFVHQPPAWHCVEPLPHPGAGGEGKTGNQSHRRDGLEAAAEMEAPDADWIRNDDDGQEEQEIERPQPVIAFRVDAARIMMLEPVGADHDVAETQREKLAPLLGDGVRQVAVAMRTVGRSGDLDLDNQQGQRDGINRVAEPLEAVESALGTVLLRAGAASAFGWHRWIGFADQRRTTSAGRSPLKPRAYGNPQRRPSVFESYMRCPY